MTRPTQIVLVMSPDFNETVMCAAQSFKKAGLVPPDWINTRLQHIFEQTERRGDSVFTGMNEHTLGMELHYSDGHQRDLRFDLAATPDELEDRNATRH